MGVETAKIEERTMKEKEILVFTSAFNRTKKWLSLTIALIFLFNISSPAWARQGNYGKTESWDAFAQGALAGLVTTISCALNPVAGAVGSVAGDITGLVMYYCFYETHGKPMELFGSELKLFGHTITQGQFWSMVASVVASAAAGYFSGKDAVKTTAETTANTTASTASTTASTAATAVTAGTSATASVISNVLSFINTLFKSIVEYLKLIWRTFWSLIKNPLNPVKAIKEIGSSLKKFFRSLVDSFKSTRAGIKEKIAEGVKKGSTKPFNSVYGYYGSKGLWQRAVGHVVFDVAMGTIRLSAQEAIKKELEEAGWDETMASLAADALTSHVVMPFVSAALGCVVCKFFGWELANNGAWLDGDDAKTARQINEIGNEVVEMKEGVSGASQVSSEEGQSAEGAQPKGETPTTTEETQSDQKGEEETPPTEGAQTTEGPPPTSQGQTPAGEPETPTPTTPPSTITLRKLVNIPVKKVDPKTGKIAKKETSLLELSKNGEIISMEKASLKGEDGKESSVTKITFKNGETIYVSSPELTSLKIDLASLPQETIRTLVKYVNLLDHLIIGWTGGSMTDPKGNRLTGFNPLIAGLKAIQNQGPAPFINAIAKILALQALGYKTYYGQDPEKIYENLKKMIIARTIGDFAGGLFANWDGLGRLWAGTGYDEIRKGNLPGGEVISRIPLNPYSTRGEKTFSQYLLWNSLRLAGSAVSEILLAKYCKDHNIDSPLRGLVHLGGSVLTASLLDAIFRRDPGKGEKAEETLYQVDEQGKRVSSSPTTEEELKKEGWEKVEEENKDQPEGQDEKYVEYEKDGGVRRFELVKEYKYVVGTDDSSPYYRIGKLRFGTTYRRINPDGSVSILSFTYEELKKKYSEGEYEFEKRGDKLITKKKKSLDGDTTKEVIAEYKIIGPLENSLNSLGKFGICLGETSRNYIVPSAIDSGFFAYPYFSPATGLNASQAHWQHQAKLADYIYAMMQGISPIQILASQMENNMIKYASQHFGKSFSASIHNILYEGATKLFPNLVEKIRREKELRIELRRKRRELEDKKEQLKEQLKEKEKQLERKREELQILRGKEKLPLLEDLNEKDQERLLSLQVGSKEAIEKCEKAIEKCEKAIEKLEGEIKILEGVEISKTYEAQLKEKEKQLERKREELQILRGKEKHPLLEDQERLLQVGSKEAIEKCEKAIEKLEGEIKILKDVGRLKTEIGGLEKELEESEKITSSLRAKFLNLIIGFSPEYAAFITDAERKALDLKEKQERKAQLEREEKIQSSFNVKGLRKLCEELEGLEERKEELKERLQRVEKIKEAIEAIEEYRKKEVPSQESDDKDLPPVEGIEASIGSLKKELADVESQIQKKKIDIQKMNEGAEITLRETEFSDPGKVKELQKQKEQLLKSIELLPLEESVKKKISRLIKKEELDVDFQVDPQGDTRGEESHEGLELGEFSLQPPSKEPALSRKIQKGRELYQKIREIDSQIEKMTPAGLTKELQRLDKQRADLEKRIGVLEKKGERTEAEQTELHNAIDNYNELTQQRWVILERWFEPAKEPANKRLKQKIEEKESVIDQMKRIQSLSRGLGWIPFVGDLAQVLGSASIALQEKGYVDLPDIIRSGIIDYTVDRVITEQRLQREDIDIFRKLIETSPELSDGEKERKLKAIEEGKIIGIESVYRPSIAGVPQPIERWGNFPLEILELPSGTSKFGKIPHFFIQRTREEIKSDIKRRVDEGEVEEDIIKEQEEYIIKQIGENEWKKIAGKDIYEKFSIAEGKIIKNFRDERGMEHITWLIEDEGDKEEKKKEIKEILSRLERPTTFYHPDSGLLQYTPVDRFGRMLQTSYYGKDYTGEEWQTVKLDKTTQHYYGPFGYAGSVTKDYTEIGLPQHWLLGEKKKIKVSASETKKEITSVTVPDVSKYEEIKTLEKDLKGAKTDPKKMESILKKMEELGLLSGKGGEKISELENINKENLEKIEGFVRGAISEYSKGLSESYGLALRDIMSRLEDVNIEGIRDLKDSLEKAKTWEDLKQVGDGLIKILEGQEIKIDCKPIEMKRSGDAEGIQIQISRPPDEMVFISKIDKFYEEIFKIGKFLNLSTVELEELMKKVGIRGLRGDDFGSLEKLSKRCEEPEIQKLLTDPLKIKALNEELGRLAKEKFCRDFAKEVSLVAISLGVETEEVAKILAENLGLKGITNLDDLISALRRSDSFPTGSIEITVPEKERVISPATEDTKTVSSITGLEAGKLIPIYRTTETKRLPPGNWIYAGIAKDRNKKLVHVWIKNDGRVKNLDELREKLKTEGRFTAFDGNIVTLRRFTKQEVKQYTDLLRKNRKLLEELQGLVKEIWGKDTSLNLDTVWGAMLAYAVANETPDGKSWSELTRKEKRAIIQEMTYWRLLTFNLYKEDGVIQKSSQYCTKYFYPGSTADTINFSKVKTIYLPTVVVKKDPVIEKESDRIVEITLRPLERLEISPLKLEKKEISKPPIDLSFNAPSISFVTPHKIEEKTIHIPAEHRFISVTPSLNLSPNIYYDMNFYPTGRNKSPYTGPSYRTRVKDIGSDMTLEHPGDGFYPLLSYCVSTKAFSLKKEPIQELTQKLTDFIKESYGEEYHNVVDPEKLPGIIMEFCKTMGKGEEFIQTVGKEIQLLVKEKPIQEPPGKEVQEVKEEVQKRIKLEGLITKITTELFYKVTDEGRLLGSFRSPEGNYKVADEELYNYLKSPLSRLLLLDLSEYKRIREGGKTIGFFLPIWGVNIGYNNPYFEEKLRFIETMKYAYDYNNIRKAIVEEKKYAQTIGDIRYADFLNSVRISEIGGLGFTQRPPFDSWDAFYSSEIYVPAWGRYRELFPHGLFENEDAKDIGSSSIIPRSEIIK